MGRGNYALPFLKDVFITRSKTLFELLLLRKCVVLTPDPHIPKKIRGTDKKWDPRLKSFSICPFQKCGKVIKQFPLLLNNLSETKSAAVKRRKFAIWNFFPLQKKKNPTTFYLSRLHIFRQNPIMHGEKGISLANKREPRIPHKTRREYSGISAHLQTHYRELAPLPL